jgi:hypothetical protein
MGWNDHLDPEAGDLVDVMKYLKDAELDSDGPQWPVAEALIANGGRCGWIDSRAAEDLPGLREGLSIGLDPPRYATQSLRRMARNSA